MMENQMENMKMNRKSNIQEYQLMTDLADG